MGFALIELSLRNPESKNDNAIFNKSNTAHSGNGFAQGVKCDETSIPGVEQQ
ncbi:hypothetical protein EDC23_0117 [Thiohalophilus thiocyanatoxydans]|uniref:Uncharacterized protein n=1 Tax=Thiohalophilus thiocyanatoxydans TaxID=381308 RepID=A0A4R8ISY9_9GAMM|nr:hypothetical protein EDC23_0117 [Thiohalophilus thiocyanatoxydans]